jgi:hypothetical protein
MLVHLIIPLTLKSFRLMTSVGHHLIGHAHTPASSVGHHVMGHA